MKNPNKKKQITKHVSHWSAVLAKTLRTKRFWVQTLLGVLIVFVLWLGSIFVMAQWYIKRHDPEPLTWGVTFIAPYARYLDQDPEETLLALRDDLGFRRFRLVSYWSDIEKSPGEYDFSELDWQFDAIEQVGGEVSLAIGLRQPRWPECHVPGWVDRNNKDMWYPALKKFITATVNRYKDRVSLDSYQLENEFFLKVFGECPDFDRDRLKDEFELVKKLDSKHPIILSMANNYFGVPTGQPRADQVGVSVYKRVFDYTVTKRYFEYPFPSWYYAGRAGMTELLTGRDSMLHELQAEPWPPVPIKEASIEEQNKSMDAKRLKERLGYAKAIGFKDIDLWGGEWWYWRKVAYNDPSLWNVVKEELQKK
jgi:hypothetical protein